MIIYIAGILYSAIFIFAEKKSLRAFELFYNQNVTMEKELLEDDSDNFLSDEDYRLSIRMSTARESRKSIEFV